MNISEAEKIKNPVLAFIAGMIFSAGVTWIAVTNIHSEQFRMYELERLESLKEIQEFEKQDAIQKNELEAKQNEVLSLRKRLEVSSGNLSKDKAARLQSLIRQIDAEIVNKKEVLGRESGIFTDDPKSDSYIRTEKEIDDLHERRNQAQKQLIEVNSQ